jgi:hypothetical protein
LKNPNRPRKGTPTDPNIWVLAQIFPVGRTSTANRFPATDLPHLRRCLKAGLAIGTRRAHGRDGVLRLTARGIAVLAAYRAAAIEIPASQLTAAIRTRGRLTDEAAAMLSDQIAEDEAERDAARRVEALESARVRALAGIMERGLDEIEAKWEPWPDPDTREVEIAPPVVEIQCGQCGEHLYPSDIGIRAPDGSISCSPTCDEEAEEKSRRAHRKAEARSRIPKWSAEAFDKVFGAGAFDKVTDGGPFGGGP